jgi:hypothetical protein
MAVGDHGAAVSARTVLGVGMRLRRLARGERVRRGGRPGQCAPIAPKVIVPASHAIVIGASTGGVAALLELVSGLPKTLQAVVGVVLHVLKAIKDCGGAAVVQDPAEAVEPAMPASALANVAVDHRVPVKPMAPLLLELLGRERTVAGHAAPEGIAREHAIFEGRNVMENLAAVAEPSALTCPDCGGGLWELKDSKPLRYRCHTGHAFTAASLEAAQTETAEYALWSSVRALQERELLLRRLATVAEGTGDHPQAQAGRRAADQVRAQAQQLRKLTQEDQRTE